MYEHVLKRLAGIAIVGVGLGLASYIKFSYLEKEIAHFVVIGFAAFICVIGIGLYEEAPRRPQRKNATHNSAAGVFPTLRLRRSDRKSAQFTN